jgi:hypothetical protein
MRKKPEIRSILAVALLCVAAAGPVAGAETIEGRWLLEKQSYGSGSANQAQLAEPLRMEFYREGERLVGRIWFGGQSAESVPWPSLGQAPVRSQEVVVSPAEDRVRVRYRSEPAPGTDVVLEITEEYRVTDGGTALSGTVTVAVLRGGKPGGSYVLQRRFRREP